MEESKPVSASKPASTSRNRPRGNRSGREQATESVASAALRGRAEPSRGTARKRWVNGWRGDPLTICNRLMGQGRSPFSSRIHLIADQLILSFKNAWASFAVRQKVNSINETTFLARKEGENIEIVQTLSISGQALFWKAHHLTLLALTPLSISARFGGPRKRHYEAGDRSAFRRDIMNKEAVKEMALIGLDEAINALSDSTLKGIPLLGQLRGQIEVLRALVSENLDLAISHDPTPLSLSEQWAPLIRRCEATLFSLAHFDKHRLALGGKSQVDQFVDVYLQAIEGWKQDIEEIRYLLSSLEGRPLSLITYHRIHCRIVVEISAQNMMRSKQVSRLIEEIQRQDISPRVVADLEGLSWRVESYNETILSIIADLERLWPSLLIELGTWEAEDILSTSRTFLEGWEAGEENFRVVVTTRLANSLAKGASFEEYYKEASLLFKLWSEIKKEMEAIIAQLGGEGEPSLRRAGVQQLAFLLFDIIAVARGVVANSPELGCDRLLESEQVVKKSERAYVEALHNFTGLCQLIYQAVLHSLQEPILPHLEEKGADSNAVTPRRRLANERRRTARMNRLNDRPSKGAVEKEEREKEVEEAPRGSHAPATSLPLMASLTEEIASQPSTLSFSRVGLLTSLVGELKNLSSHSLQIQGNDEQGWRKEHLYFGHLKFVYSLHGLIHTLERIGSNSSPSYDEAFHLLDWQRRLFEGLAELSSAILPIYDPDQHVTAHIYPRIGGRPIYGHHLALDFAPLSHLVESDEVPLHWREPLSRFLSVAGCLDRSNEILNYRGVLKEQLSLRPDAATPELLLFVERLESAYQKGDAAEINESVERLFSYYLLPGLSGALSFYRCLQSNNEFTRFELSGLAHQALSLEEEVMAANLSLPEEAYPGSPALDEGEIPPLVAENSPINSIEEARVACLSISRLLQVIIHLPVCGEDSDEERRLERRNAVLSDLIHDLRLTISQLDSKRKGSHTLLHDGLASLHSALRALKRLHLAALVHLDLRIEGCHLVDAPAPGGSRSLFFSDNIVLLNHCLRNSQSYMAEGGGSFDQLARVPDLDRPSFSWLISGRRVLGNFVHHVLAPQGRELTPFAKSLAGLFRLAEEESHLLDVEEGWSKVEGGEELVRAKHNANKESCLAEVYESYLFRSIEQLQQIARLAFPFVNERVGII